jgi:signal peptidase I
MLCLSRPFARGLFLPDGASRRVAVLLAGGAAAVTAACGAPVRLGVVSGHSMEPALRPGQVFCYQSLDAQPPRRGEVVLVRMGREVCVKRVFALGGDTFWMMRPSRHCGGSWMPLDPSDRVALWRTRFPEFGYRKFRVPPGRVYVLGDDPSSVDSRTYGPVPVREVFARVVLPLTRREPGLVNSLSFRCLPPPPVDRHSPSVAVIASGLSS